MAELISKVLRSVDNSKYINTFKSIPYENVGT